MTMFQVSVYSTREYHHDEIDYTFNVHIEASDAQEAMQLIADECEETGCNERCEIMSANEVTNMNYDKPLTVSEDMVEHWLVDHKGDGDKYRDSLSNLTDLINEVWTHGGDGVPTMQELRNDIAEYNEVTN